MIKARIAKNPKILLVFDLANKHWIEEQQVSGKGIQPLLKRFMDEEISMDNISAVCLTDVAEKPKAADFKTKASYVSELIDTYGFNLIVTVGAGAFEKFVGFKGASKYFSKVLQSEIHGNKCLACPSPAAIAYDPKIADVLIQSIKAAKSEMDFPEIREREKIPVDYKIVDTIEKFREFYNHFISSAVKEYAFDLETTGLYFNRDRILSAQFSDKIGSSYLIPSDFYGNWSKEEWIEIVCCFRRLISDESKKFIYHNGKFDVKFIYHHWKIPVRKKNIFDTMVAAFLCDENTPNGLKDLACSMTDLGDYELPLDRFKDEYCKKHKMKKKDFSYDLIPFEILAPYALTDTDVTIRIYHQFKDLLIQEEQEKPFAMVMRFTYLLTRMELNGWPVDIDWAKEYRGILDESIEDLNQRLSKNSYVQQASKVLQVRALEAINAKRKVPLAELKAPFEFKFNSTPHKHALFFEIMRLAVVKTTKTKGVNGKFNPACDKAVMEKWIECYPEHEDFLVEIRTLGMLKKLRSTYVDAVLEKSVNGRLHPLYNPIGTKTGRLSSRDPNLQNVVTRADKKIVALLGFDPAKYVKKMFRAGDGKVIVGADLSAAEMRVACVVSGDPKLIEIFLSGVDVHCAIAKELFPYIPSTISDEEIKEKYPQERTIAKTVQFLSLYGGGADKLAKTAKISEERAQVILDDYFRKYSGVKRWIDETSRFIVQNGYSVTPLGRKRRVPEVNSEDNQLRAKAIRQAVNSVIQSMASDGLLLSACEFLDLIEEHNLPVTLLGPIHDALYIEVDESYMVVGKDIMLECMQKFPVEAEIPMVADAEFGKTWANFEEFSEGVSDNYEEVEDDEEEEFEELEEAA